MNILQTQHEICVEVKHITKRYTMKHSYRSVDSLNIPSEWIKVIYLISSTELSEYTEEQIINAVNLLSEKSNVSLHVDGKRLRYKKD
ncbi:hypothetical protein NVP2275O_212 [Vibrio phage 2.275.O._10N.286.54.E11]|nr:hypothetical protein NVP2275O_212 [Vibrio phage 2.275.O._10N.286.54.E11]